MRHACGEATRAAAKPEWVVYWSLRLDALVLSWGFGHDLLGIAILRDTVGGSWEATQIEELSK